jgi:peptidyl-tRNA hydrolase, PTH1 family
MGIGRPAAGKVVADFVLSSPSKQEWEMLVNAFDLSRSFIDQMVTGDMSAVMNKLNVR